MPQLAIAQASLDQEVFLWVADGDFPPKKKDANYGRRIITLSGSFASIVRQIGAPDILHDHGLWQPFHHTVAKYCNKHNVVRVVSTRGMLEPWALEQKKWKKRLAWWVYQRGDLEGAVALHSTSDPEEDQLRKLGFKQRIINLPNGLDFECMPMVFGRNFSHSVSDNRRIALFLSRVHPKKGIPMLIQAWARVRPSGWRMLVVGPGEPDYIESLRGLVDSAGLADEWAFHNPVDDDVKWGIFSSASLFVLPTYSENFGLVIAESLASGVPVITTKGAPWSGLRDKSCGWWVEAAVDEIGEALRDATTLPRKELEDMGKRGRTWAMREFSWPAIAKAMINEYTKLLGE